MYQNFEALASPEIWERKFAKLSSSVTSGSLALAAKHTFKLTALKNIGRFCKPAKVRREVLDKVINLLHSFIIPSIASGQVRELQLQRAQGRKFLLDLPTCKIFARSTEKKSN